MLLQFRVKNYKSIAEEITLDLTAEPLNDHNDFLIEKNKVKILPVAAIFGANASGKSNILDAIYSFKYNVVKSSMMGEEESFRYKPFSFNNEYKNKPTEFEIYFVIDEKEYAYGYSLKDNKIYQEWLYKRKLSKNKTVFKKIFERDEREKNRIEYNEALKYKQLKAYDHLINEQMLVLSFFNTKKIKEIDDFSEVYKWIASCLFVSPIFKKSKIEWEIYYDDPELKKNCVEFIREFDPTLEDIRIEKEDDDDSEDANYRAYSIHNKEEYNISIESDGTMKLIKLFLRIQMFLEQRGILIIDELDCQLHPLIIRRIIQMFHNKNINKFNTQIIFTSHNLIVLDKSDLRRDEVWFVEKDKKGITSFYSLASYALDSNRVRPDLDFGKNYLAGKFGAIPYL